MHASSKINFEKGGKIFVGFYLDSLVSTTIKDSKHRENDEEVINT